MDKAILILSAFFCLSAIFNPIFVEAKIHQNDEYGFQIEYPDNWAIDDRYRIFEEMPGVDSGGAILVSVSDGINWWNHFVSVTMIRNDTTAINYENQEFLDKLSSDLKLACNELSFDFGGILCKNHSVEAKKIIEIDGKKAYQIKESWTEFYQDGTNSSKISILTNIVEGDDVWQIDAITSAENYTQISPTLNEIIDSFKFIEVKQSDLHEPNVPDWVRHTAGWWAEGSVSDLDFANGIEFLISEDIIHIAETVPSSTTEGNHKIPSWVKNNAGWWSQGLISDDDFLKGILFMVENEIIKV